MSYLVILRIMVWAHYPEHGGGPISIYITGNGDYFQGYYLVFGNNFVNMS